MFSGDFSSTLKLSKNYAGFRQQVPRGLRGGKQCNTDKWKWRVCREEATLSLAIQMEEVNPDTPSYWPCVHVVLGGFVER